VNAAVQARTIQAAGHRVPLWALALPVLIVVLITAFGVAAVLGSRSTHPVWVASGHARLGAAAPDFSSWDLGGKKVGLADFRDRPLLLTFWATWCTACRDEMPALQSLRDRYRAGGFEVLAVNYRETSTDRMSQYLAGLNVNLASVIDPDGAIASAYGVDIGLPVNVVLDRSHAVARILVGEAPTATIQSAIEQVVAPVGT
jgi:thiol-disulfide isomerase/thioredoxin